MASYQLDDEIGDDIEEDDDFDDDDDDLESDEDDDGGDEEEDDEETETWQVSALRGDSAKRRLSLDFRR